MSQPAPDRTVAPPPRRPIDASRLLKDRREGAQSPAPATPEASAPAAATPSRSVAPPIEAGEEPKEPVSVQIRRSIRGRARAAFRELQYHEDIDTFAEFVERALEREIERTEAAYNEGQPFAPVTKNLPAGRRVGR